MHIYLSISICLNISDYQKDTVQNKCGTNGQTSMQYSVVK